MSKYVLVGEFPNPLNVDDWRFVVAKVLLTAREDFAQELNGPLSRVAGRVCLKKLNGNKYGVTYRAAKEHCL